MAEKEDDGIVKQTIESIRLAVNERLASQVVGTFILFWLLFNWPILVLLWKSQLPVEDTIKAIYETRLTLLRSLIYPATATVVYLLVYPWISFAASIYHDWVNKKRILKKQKQDVEILKSKKDIFEAEADLELVKLKKKHVLEIEAKQWEADWLRKGKENEKALEKQNSYDAVNEAKQKIDYEMQIREHRLNSEAAMRAKYPAYFDQTKNVDLE